MHTIFDPAMGRDGCEYYVVEAKPELAPNEFRINGFVVEFKIELPTLRKFRYG